MIMPGFESGLFVTELDGMVTHEQVLGGGHLDLKLSTSGVQRMVEAPAILATRMVVDCWRRETQGFETTPLRQVSCHFRPNFGAFARERRLGGDGIDESARKSMATLLTDGRDHGFEGRETA